MSDETVITKGRVWAINGQCTFENGVYKTLEGVPISTISLEPGSLNTDVTMSSSIHSGVDVPSQIFVKAALIYGEEYEVVVRKVKTVVPSIAQPGNRKFTDEEGVEF